MKNKWLWILVAGGVAFYIYNRKKKASAAMLPGQVPFVKWQGPITNVQRGPSAFQTYVQNAFPNVKQ